MNYSDKASLEFPFDKNALHYFKQVVGKAREGQVQTIVNNFYNRNLNYNDIPKK